MELFEQKTYTSILSEMLESVSNDIDKREGSIIFDALAPAAMKLAEFYSDLDVFLRLVFADTSEGEFLERRVAEYGVYKRQASAAIRKAVITDTNSLPLDIVIGARFQLDGIVYETVEFINAGEYKLKAEVEGEVGNKDFGDLIPLETIDGLGKAELTDVIVPGRNEETEEELYARYLDSLNTQPFGGNRDDYRLKISNIEGVGAVKLTRLGGGQVKATIIDSSFNIPNALLVSRVKEIMDPTEFEGGGLGLAPIGHTVIVEAAVPEVVDISTTLSLGPETTLGQIEEAVISALDNYLLLLRKSWQDETSIVVRISQLESQILLIPGIVDISNTQINGINANLNLPSETIPVIGEVTISV